MSKAGTIFIATFVALVLLFLVCRQLNVFEYYSVSTASSFPTIEEGDVIFTSNLLTPERNDFVCYRTPDGEYGKETWIHRLCAVEGDKVQVKNGDLYVNGHLADKGLQLSHRYVANISELQKVKAVVDKYSYTIEDDTVLFHIADKGIAEYGIKAARYPLPPGHSNDIIVEKFNKNWNVDNFGPVRVPRGKFFVMGDNRNNVIDSRYLGFIDKADYLGTAINR
jgi:signal peptidase I